MSRPLPLLALLASFALVALAVPAPRGDAATPGEAALAPDLQNPGFREHPPWFKESFLDLREDVSEAAQADRRVILYFYQDGCPYCAKLLQEGLGDQRVGTLARTRFDWIAINLWGDRELTGFSGEPSTEKRFAASLKVQFTPTLLLLDEGGKTVLRINGYYPPHKLGAALAYAAQRREQHGQSFPDFLAALAPREAQGKLHREAGFLPHPLRLADNRDTSSRPLVVLFEQPNCRDCDALHADTLRRGPLAYSLTAFDAAILDAWSGETVQTPDGREIPAREWSAELGIQYTPSLVFYDAAGREVFRTEGWLRPFHIHGALDYVATGAYIGQPSFQRYLSARREALAGRGIAVDLME